MVVRERKAICAGQRTHKELHREDQSKQRQDSCQEEIRRVGRELSQAEALLRDEWNSLQREEFPLDWQVMGLFLSNIEDVIKLSIK